MPFHCFSLHVGSRHGRFSLSALLLLAALLLSSPVLVGCGGDEAEAEAAADAELVDFELGAPLTDSTYAAIVETEEGTDTLYADQFRQQFQFVVQQFPTVQGNPEQMREIRRRIVEEFVMVHAIGEELDRRGLVADTGRVSERLAQFRMQLRSEAAYQQWLQSQGLSEDSLRALLGEEVRQQMLQEQIAEEAEDPTAAELEAFRQERAAQVRAQHILFYSPEENDSVRAVAQVVLDSAQAGHDFAELARRHSDDGSASRGGDLNYFSRGDMVEPFEDAVFALADSGDIAPEVVRTQFGYHIIRLTGRRENPMMDSTQARQLMMQDRQQQVLRRSYNRLRGSVVVRVNEEVVDADLNEPLAMQ